jgi:ferritin-like metal-binding protein YciE
MNNLQQLFEGTLKDVYYAEKAILKALPKMAKKATSEALRAAFEEHIQQTEEQVTRLEQIFSMLQKPARAKRCAAMDGITEEASEIMQEAEAGTVRDAGMLAAAQAVEHYEISRYGTLAAWAQKLGMDDAVVLLETTLDEEKETDAKLSALAVSEINIAADEDEDEDKADADPASGNENNRSQKIKTTGKRSSKSP